MAVRSKVAQPEDKSSPLGLWAPDYQALMATQQRALSGWFQTLTAMSQEMARFAQERWQEDMTVLSTLAGCRNAEDAIACQRHFAVQATTQYSEEFAKMSALVAGMATDGLAALGSKAAGETG